MRSRLDEIVEEETAGTMFPVGNGGGLPIACEDIRNRLARIAGRSFRHGVERTEDIVRELIRGSGVALSIWDVQPAPAEEKNFWQDGPTYFRAPGGIPVKNERKGQRRVNPHCGCWCTRLGWYDKLHPRDRDRLAHGNSRSGQDRRKG